MKAILAMCILLYITTGTEAADINSTTKEPLQRQTDKTTSERLITTKLANVTIASTTASTTISPNITTASPTTTTSATKPPPPTTSTSTTTTLTTTTISSTTPIPSNSTTTVPPPPPKPTMPTTTPLPLPTLSPSQSTPEPPKERHFDGLSFMGGIILTTCFVGMGAFSWKFYKAWTDRSYRTL